MKLGAVDAFVALDTETTGVDAGLDRLVSAAVLLVDARTGDVLESHRWLCNPGEPIPTEAAELHGIDDAAVESAPTIDAVLPELLDVVEALSRQTTDMPPRPLVVYNAPYDLTLLERESRRAGLKERFYSVYGGCYVIDPKVLHGWLINHGERTYGKLSRVVGFYQVELEDVHQADADALAAARVLTVQLQRYPVQLDVELQQLHDQQSQWYAFLSAGLQQYLERERGYRYVNKDWPITPHRIVDGYEE